MHIIAVVSHLGPSARGLSLLVNGGLFGMKQDSIFRATMKKNPTK